MNKKELQKQLESLQKKRNKGGLHITDIIALDYEIKRVKKDIRQISFDEYDELQRFRESIVVLHKLVNDNKSDIDTILDKIGNAVSDLIFGHSIRSEEFLTDDEFIEAVKDIEELVNFKEHWDK